MESVRMRGKKERTVVISRDATGYGLTLSGDQPVFVATVRSGGAAERAGVRRNDLIVAVNGNSVVNASHLEVVETIQAHARVSLTLISGRSGSKALSSSSSFVSLASFGSHQQQQRLSADLNQVVSDHRLNSSTTTNTSTSVNRRITAPIAPNIDAAQALADERLHTIQLMVEQERRHVDQLRQELASEPSTKRREELEAAVKRLAKLQSQLNQPPSIKQSRRRTSLAEPTRSAPPVPPSTNGSSLSLSPLLSPPPLPARNRTPPKSNDKISVTTAVPPRRSEATPPPLPPPRPSSSSHSTPTSVAEVASVANNSGDKNGNVANSSSRQSTNPELKEDEDKSGSNVSPAPSEVRHERTKSSPSSLGEPPTGYLGFGRPMGRVSPRYETPPGTPPPPYDEPEERSEGLVTWPQLCAASSSTNEAIINMEDDDDDDDDCDNDDDANDEEKEDDDDDDADHRKKKIHSSAILDRRQSSLAFGCDILPSEETPFKNFRDLLCHNAHLSVFINYVMSNSDPAAICFYLVTDNYVSGSLKDMQRWAYEIHSSFLIPEAPLAVANLTQGIINDIDRWKTLNIKWSLVSDFEDENVMRQLFLKARDVAKKELKEELSDFSEKRAAGLGAMFGPPDNELRACVENRVKELQVIDDLLLPILDSLSDDLESASPRNSTLASSLATILSKNFNARNTSSNASVLDRCPTFASKERKRDKLLFGLSSSSAKKLNHVKGHVFELKQYTQLTRCNYSQEIIWGIGPQGYHCFNCGYNVLKRHMLRVEEVCVGPTKHDHQRSRGKNMFSRILSDRELPGRKASGHVGNRESNNDDLLSTENKNNNESQVAGGDASARGSPMASLLTSETMTSSETSTPTTTEESVPQQSSSTSFIENNKKRRTSSSAASKSASFTLGDAHGKRLMESVMRSKIRDGSGRRESKSASKVDRSHSLRDQKKRSSSTRDRRQNSESNIQRAKSDSIANERDSPSSSSSSLNARSSLASPSTSQDALATPPAAGVMGVATMVTTPTSDSDSDSEPDDWRQSVSAEQLAAMGKREAKRQDIINELFQTERSHVRTLRVLRNLFYVPLMEGNMVDNEFVNRLFPNLDQVLKWHTSCNAIMRDKRKLGWPIGQVASILHEMFEGVNGDALIEAGATFTENQRSSIEALKERRHRDNRLNAFLEDTERRPECRRLQLQAILPCEHQRLVKYPLLLEQLAKQSESVVPNGEKEELSNECTTKTTVLENTCAEDEDDDLKEGIERKSFKSEQSILRSLVRRTRLILESIDKRVAIAENAQRLADIQKHLDTSGLDKFPDSPISHEYRNVDLRQQRLLHDGSLTLKLGDTRRFKTVELHVVLLEDCIMLLQKHDDKFVLKFHANANSSNVNNANPEKFMHAPVIKFSNMLVRNVATDKRAFYLLNTTPNGPQIYELVASSTADRSQWFRHITEATNAFRSRESNRRLTRGGGSTASMPAMPSNFGLTPTSSLENSKTTTEKERTSAETPREEPKVAARSHSFQERGQTRTDDEDKKTDLRSKANSDRNLQRVQTVIEPLSLIRPEMVKVRSNECHKAETVVTNIELLRQKDAEVAQALQEKQRIIAEILRIPNDDSWIHSTDESERNAAKEENKEPKDVLLAALAQAKSLSELVNASLDLPTRPNLNVSSETTPSMATPTSSTPISSRSSWTQVNAAKLVSISTHINKHLTTLLTMMNEGQDLGRVEPNPCNDGQEERVLDDLHPYEELDLETTSTRTATELTVASTSTSDEVGITSDNEKRHVQDVVDTPKAEAEESPQEQVGEATDREMDQVEDEREEVEVIVTEDVDEKSRSEQEIGSVRPSEDLEALQDCSLGKTDVSADISTDIESSQESIKEEGSDAVGVTTEDSDLSSAV